MRYFAFIDGSLGYDCPRCGARCCHGLGFEMAASELVPLLSRRPAAAPFVQAQDRGKRAAVLDLSTEGCWFLRPDGRCGVEVEDGRAAKPAVCRLFPFNQLSRIGPVLLIEPQLLRCPLADAGGQGTRHAEVSADLDSVEEGGLACQRAPLPAGLPDDWVAREEAARERAAAHLDVPHPLALAQALCEEDAEAARLSALWPAWLAVLAPDGLAGDGLAAAVSRSLALLAPALRVATFFGGSAAPYPKTARRLPALLLGTGLLSLLAGRAVAPRPLSLRAVAEVHRATPLLREVLARWDRPAQLAPPLPEQWVQIDWPDPALQAAHHVLARLLAGTPLPLGQAFAEASAGLPPALRFLLLRALADRSAALRFG